MSSDPAAVYALDHHDKIAPKGFHNFDTTSFRINGRYVKIPLFQFHVVYYKSAILHVEDFHRAQFLDMKMKASPSRTFLPI